MSVVVIDIQGFMTPDFLPKEMAVWNGERLAHYVFKEPFPFSCLTDKLQRQAAWLTKNHHMLKWSDGDVELSRIPHILSDIKKTYATKVYCKGDIKYKYLRRYFEEVTDLGKIENLKNLPKNVRPYVNAKCFYHNKGACAIDNVKLLYDYLLHPYATSSERTT